MPTTVEMDKAGRLVIPKRIRDTLHLLPGSALQVEVRGEDIVLSPHTPSRGLYEEDGLLIYDGGVPITAEDVNAWIAREREYRTHHVLSEG